MHFSIAASALLSLLPFGLASPLRGNSGPAGLSPRASTCPQKGYIYLKRNDDNSNIGLLKNVPDNEGSYVHTTQNNNEALLVCVYDPSSDGTFYIRSLNAGPPSDYSTLWFGIVGSPTNGDTNSTIGAGTANYGYIAQTAQTDHGAKPAIIANSVSSTLYGEASVWKFKSSGSTKLVPVWRNSNNKQYTLDILYDNTYDAIVVAQADKFVPAYPDDDLQALVFYFVKV